MKKGIVIVLFALLAAGAFAESTLQLSATHSVYMYIMEPAGNDLIAYYPWPYNLDIAAVTYLHPLSEGSRFQVGGDIGRGTWGLYATADAAYSWPLFSAGNFDFTLRGVGKVGVYVPFIAELHCAADLELLAFRPGRHFFFGAGLSDTFSGLWGRAVDCDTGEESFTYKMVERADFKITCGWRL